MSTLLYHQDIASHTRLSPMAREACFKKFIENVNSNPKVSGIMMWSIDCCINGFI